MRNPVKRLKLYEAMKLDIASGVYANEAFLPNELELAQKYGYSRDTVRSALAMLEDDRIIELLECKSKGRRICPVDVKRTAIPITFLLPCPNFISDTILSPYSQHTHQMLKGVSQIAFEHNCRVQTVPVSPTNYPHDIDWNQLDFINSESMILVDGYWYCDLFPLFKERGCKVVFIDNQDYMFKLYADYLKNWFVLSLNRVSAMKSAVKLLADRGCLRIALAHSDIEETDHPVLQGYNAGMADCGLKYTARIDTSNTSNKTIAGVIADFYKKNHFDGLLLDPFQVCRLRTQQSLNYCLGLPENVKIMANDEINYNQQAFPSLSGLDFPYDEIGRVAARYLLESEFIPGRQIFSAQIIERESTMHETERLALITI